MDHRTKAVFVIFLLSVLLLTLLVYKKYFIDKEYLIYAEIPCDPATEICFVYHCDPGEEECTGIPEEDTTYYKKIERGAAFFPTCDPNEESCAISSCEKDSSDCVVTVCDVSDAEVECSSPEGFGIETEEEELDISEAVESQESMEASSVEEGLQVEQKE